LGNYPITRLPDTRIPEAIGRAARLELRFERRRGRTVLAHSYAEPPFRTGGVFDLDGAAYVILVTSGPGIFAGDALQVSIHVGRGATVMLTSQAALQVHPPAHPAYPAHLAHPAHPAPASAVLRHSYHVDEDAELQCHWDPVIPFAASRLDQRFEVQVAESSRLYWTDALMAGRVSRGEAWQFESLAHELRLRVGSRLAYLERYTLTPPDDRAGRIWTSARATHLATVLARHPGATRELVDALYHRIQEEVGDGIGVDLVEPGLVVARLMGSNGASFGRARASYRAFALESIFGVSGRVPRK
jgi:urease accessory protein UreH